MSTYEGKALNTIASAFWIYKGTASVEAINKATPRIGYTYTLTDAGKITNGNIDVVKGDVVCFLNGGWILVTEGNLGAVVTALKQQMQNIDRELSGTRQDLTNRISNTDKTLADYKDEMVIEQTRQDDEIAKRLTTSDFNAYKQQQAQTDKAQDDAIAELRQHEQVNADWNSTSGVSQILNKPNLHAVATSGSYNDLTDKPTPISPTSQCVPYSNDLDSVSDDLGVAWMNTNKESREFGHLYKKKPSEGNYEQKTLYINQDIDAINVKAGTYVRIGTAYEWGLMVVYRNYADNKDIFVWCGGNFDNGTDIPKSFDGKIKIADYRTVSNASDRQDDSYWHFVSDWEWHDKGEEKGGWEDVYDTSTITADITAEVERATTAENELSERIDTKADASTWSNELKQQIDTDHATLSGLSAKWTDILKSQIDADHTTLGNINTYLSEAKRTSIDDAIVKAHTQNTDTMLNNGTLKVESNRISSTMPIMSGGDIQGTDTEGNTHLLSKKMNSDMIRTYNSLDEIIADTNRPKGCWCAIIE